MAKKSITFSIDDFQLPIGIGCAVPKVATGTLRRYAVSLLTVSPVGFIPKPPHFHRLGREISRHTPNRRL